MLNVGIRHCLFDWGNTLMVDQPGMHGPMCNWPQVASVAGAVAVLQCLSSQVSCHLATNAADSDEQQIRKALDRVGLSHFIDRIFCSANLGYDKRSPHYYAGIVQALNCSHASVLMIGDSLNSDVIGAIDSGLRAIWYNPQNHPVPEGIQSISHLDELIKKPSLFASNQFC